MKQQWISERLTISQENDTKTPSNISSFAIKRKPAGAVYREYHDKKVKESAGGKIQ